MKKERTNSKLKKAILTTITMGIVILCLGLLVALFMYNKIIGFVSCFIFVIILIGSAKLGDIKRQREMLAKIRNMKNKKYISSNIR